MCDVSNKINIYNNMCSEEKNRRYKSWEYCKNYFDENRDKINDPKVLEFMCLHLAFYLASWGMYRGSSFLLQNDYMIHENVIKIILDPEYDMLWNYNPIENSEGNNIKFLDKLFGTDEEIKNKDKNQHWCGLIGKIEKAYKFDENDEDIATDTLITKILIGTLGCIPAYDRFLKQGIADFNKKTKNKYKGFTQTLSKKSFKEMFKIIKECNFDSVKGIKYYGKKYPIMKLVDMYFWEIGYELDILAYLNEVKNDSNSKNNKIKRYKNYIEKIGKKDRDGI